MTKEQDTELHNLFFLNADVWTEENDWTMSIEPFKRCYTERITWLETANAFHKKEAEEAVAEQYRLIKENTTLFHVILEQARAKDILINRIEGLRKT